MTEDILKAEEGEGLPDLSETALSEEEGGVAAPGGDVKREDDDTFRGEIVTEAVRHERRIAHSSELSATIEVSENHAEGEMTDSEFLAGEKPVIHYHLSDYDGPLDLLLQLINAAKIDIDDIFISDVTRQYVEIITSIPREELDFEYAGEFITMAAELVYLKSLRTLPGDDDEDDDSFEDPEWQRAELLRKLKAYQLMQEEAAKLKEQETVNRFYRLPTYTEKDYRVVLTNFSLPKLVEAFARVMVNASRREASVIPKKVVKERISVSDQMKHILELTSVEESFPFTSLFEPDFDKTDIITTFLAVLELLKYGRLRAVQEEVFGDIMLYAAEEPSDEPMDMDEFKEETDGKY